MYDGTADCQALKWHLMVLSPGHKRLHLPDLYPATPSPKARVTAKGIARLRVVCIHSSQIALRAQNIGS